MTSSQKARKDYSQRKVHRQFGQSKYRKDNHRKGISFIYKKMKLLCKRGASEDSILNDFCVVFPASESAEDDITNKVTFQIILLLERNVV